MWNGQPERFRLADYANDIVQRTMKVKKIVRRTKAGRQALQWQRLINRLETGATYLEPETLFDTPVRKPKSRIDAAT
jgi:hypothetical protein